MINKIKEIVRSALEEQQPKPPDHVVLVDPQGITGAPAEPDLRIIGLFCDVIEEKVAEIVHALLFLNESNQGLGRGRRRPIEFYISTYGGAADDMFALYDTMRQVAHTTDIHTIGMGKVMSAGVLLLAAGTKGKRRIGKYCRVMIHSAMAGSHGSLPNLMNEMEALQGLQESYVDALVTETKMTKNQIKKMLERKVNVYLSAEEAVELGIADIII
jgi:ATP-dependent Clp protease protease subunit